MIAQEILYSETQRFKQWWLWLLLIGIHFIFLFGIYHQILKNIPFGDKPMSNAGLLLTELLLLIVTLVIISIRLETQLKIDGIYFRIFPIQFSFTYISWELLDKCYLRKYSPIKDFGGWGLRYSFWGNGKAYSISGNQGLQLELTNKKKILIGTQKPDEIKVILTKMKQLKT